MSQHDTIDMLHHMILRA